MGTALLICAKGQARRIARRFRFCWRRRLRRRLPQPSWADRPRGPSLPEPLSIAPQSVQSVRDSSLLPTGSVCEQGSCSPALAWA